MDLDSSSGGCRKTKKIISTQLLNLKYIKGTEIKETIWKMYIIFLALTHHGVLKLFGRGINPLILGKPG